MYLSVASKEEDGVRNIADAVAATAGQRSLPARAPDPATPTQHPDENVKLPLGWVPRGAGRRLQNRLGGRRGDHRDASNLHRLHAAPATEEAVISTGQRPPPSGTAPPSPCRGRRLRSPAPTGESAGRHSPGPTPLRQELIGAGVAYRAPAPAPASPERRSSTDRRPEEPRAQIPATPFTGIVVFDRRCLRRWRGREDEGERAAAAG